MLYLANFLRCIRPMRDEKNRIDERHRKELLGFLLVKTAAVRQGVKPAELLRVRHCYEGVNSEGLHICLYRSDIYGILGLDYMELKVESLERMRLYASAEDEARAALQSASGIEDFISMISLKRAG